MDLASQYNKYKFLKYFRKLKFIFMKEPNSKLSTLQALSTWYL